MIGPLGRIAVSVTMLALLQGSGRAADAARTASVPLPPVQPRQPDVAPPPPYQAKLDRLAELMGTLTFLHTLCGDAEASTWRARMQTLLDAEGTTDARRDRLAGSFNRGYRGYQVSYRLCTPAAQTVIARTRTEGAKVAADVAAQFGTP